MDLSLEEKVARIKLFRQECNFVTSAVSKTSLPKTLLPEIAFVGKSNVGKSSLINSLIGRKNLARVSCTPGRTRQINFFALGNKLMLVDLPGYGYAKVSMVEHKNWEKLIVNYLFNRKNLSLVCLLIDARRGIKLNDLTVINMLEEQNVHFQIVLTKADKLSKTALTILNEQIKTFINEYKNCNQEVIITSARRQDGAQELRLSLGQYRAQ